MTDPDMFRPTVVDPELLALVSEACERAATKIETAFLGDIENWQPRGMFWRGT